MKSGKLVNALLLVVLMLLFSTTIYAKPFSEALNEGLVKINDFFEQGKYEPYTKTIDFTVFLLLFVSIYLIGVRYAFKEVTRTEKAIAVVLGVMSAFLMVLNDYSIIALLPYVPLLLYIFLFILLWLVLKGMKSKFWRFIVALLVTLLIAALLEGWFSVEELPALSVAAVLFKNGNKK